MDYEDFLRSRGLEIWPKEHPYVLRFREINRNPEATYETYRRAVEHPDPWIRANAMISLTKVTTYLLKKQIDVLEEEFVRGGGMREAMLSARLDFRASKSADLR